MSITWDKIASKYPEDRNEMSEERKRHMSVTVLTVMNRSVFQINSGALLVIIKIVSDRVLQ